MIKEERWREEGGERGGRLIDKEEQAIRQRSGCRGGGEEQAASGGLSKSKPFSVLGPLKHRQCGEEGFITELFHFDLMSVWFNTVKPLVQVGLVIIC